MEHLMWVLRSLSILFFAACVLCGCVPSHPPSVVRANWVAPNFDAGSHHKLAVLVEDRTRDMEDGQLRQIEDEFNQALLEKGYRIAARSDYERIAKEMKFQHSGWTDADAAELGRMLNTNGVVIVTVVEHRVRQNESSYLRYGREYQYGLYAQARMSARIVSVELGEILGVSSLSAEVSIPNREAAPQVIEVVARNLAREFPSRRTKPATLDIDEVSHQEKATH